ncbi:hypothetical protein BT96DRAFT_690516 [Gymnopus androsaceus JB14]|uniref:Uncharacterized protein n=1 Tax=Gymnopus androsaceus JB14 TaxID=1447944 RepID=A0A6A4HMP7_9AGAR|nr:hypothetical protein BT96DRAFT_690516 [Gymnopus androsaceus JB14]
MTNIQLRHLLDEYRIRQRTRPGNAALGVLVSCIKFVLSGLWTKLVADFGVWDWVGFGWRLFGWLLFASVETFSTQSTGTQAYRTGLAGNGASTFSRCGWRKVDFSERRIAGELFTGTTLANRLVLLNTVYAFPSKHGANESVIDSPVGNSEERQHWSSGTLESEEYCTLSAGDLRESLNARPLVKKCRSFKYCFKEHTIYSGKSGLLGE